MLGKVLSVEMGSANNPWKPQTQEEYNTIVSDATKVGNYVEYSGSTYRIESEYFSGSFAVGNTYQTVYFDTTKTPYSYIGASDETTVFLDGLNKTLGIKYLMADDTRCSEELFTIKLKRGLAYAFFTDGTGRAIIGVDKDGYSPIYDDGLIAYSNKWYTEDMGEGGAVSFKEDFTPTTVLSSLYTWNGYIAYPKFVPQYARRYYPLSTLSTPAEASDIKKGKEAYSETGYRLTGTHEEPQNPWTPATEAEYKKLLVPSNVGNFFDYDNKITRLKTLSVSDSLAVGDSINGLYFDTTKTPTIPDFSLDYEEWNEMKLKYLFKTSATIEDSVPYCGLFWYHGEDAGKTFIALAYAASDGIKFVYGAPEAESEMTWMLGLNEGGDPTGFTLPTAETITSLNSDTNWNGVYVFKNKVVDVAEYAEVGGADAGAYTVKVIDYDGTVLLEQKGNAGDVIALPTAPTHDRLVFQEWSASVAVSDNKVTIADSDIMVGAVYTTASGQNEFDITLTKKVARLSITLNMDGTKDWGDGTSDTKTTHTYTAYGDYTILCDGTTMTTSSSAGLFGQSTGASFYCTAVRFASVTGIGAYAFSNCISLTSTTIPNNVTSIGDYAFYTCESLTSITIPNNVTSIGSKAFSICYSLTSITIPNSVASIEDSVFFSCYSLKSITIPNSVTSIEDSVFSSCYSLKSITIPNSVTSIGSNTFERCYSLIKYDFSQHTSVPTLSNTNAFSSINAICKIIVPDNLYGEWIAASNWSTYSDYIYKASEVLD